MTASPIPAIRTWSTGSTRATDFTLHQLAPYVGRMKTSMAKALIQRVSEPGDLIVDPFCGSGVVALEAAANGRAVVAGDWNPYATLLTKAKLFRPRSLAAAERQLKDVWTLSRHLLIDQDLRSVPLWIRRFFHPETLRSALAFRDACALRENDFLLACLLGILHHQRPGFLSFPSSHLVPYLRDRKFPREQFPELYIERDVFPRMQAKVARTFRRMPAPFTENRRVVSTDARQFPRPKDIAAVVTSPPYMNELDYVRDNRLRLWFVNRCLPPDLEVSARNRQTAFTELMSSVCGRLARSIRPGGFFVLVVGEVSRGARRGRTSYLTKKVFQETPHLNGFQLNATCYDTIPDIRRSRQELRGTKGETILLYQKAR